MSKELIEACEKLNFWWGGAHELGQNVINNLLNKKITALESRLSALESPLSEEAVYEGRVCSTNGGRTFFFGLHFKDYPRAKHLPHGTPVYISTKKPIRFEEEA